MYFFQHIKCVWELYTPVTTIVYGLTQRIITENGRLPEFVENRRDTADYEIQ